MGSISHTYLLDNPPCVISHAAIVGPKEGEGPLAHWFDQICQDDTLGQDSFEKRRMPAPSKHTAVGHGKG